MGILQRGDPFVGTPDLHFSLPTPECPNCGPTDYEDEITEVRASKITYPPGSGVTRKWLCVKCRCEMPKEPNHGQH